MTQARRKLLVVARDPAICRYLRRRFSQHGYEISGTQQPDRASIMISEWCPDILMLETDLLTGDSVSHIQDIKAITDIPILGLLPGSVAEDVIEALDAGVDDCIASPFSLEELAARLRKMLRRDLLRRGLKPNFTSGELQIDLLAGRIRRGNHEFLLSDIQIRLLQRLIAADGGVVAIRELVQELWGAPDSSKIGALRRAIWRVRNKIETDPHRPVHILTEVRVGYRLASPSTVPTDGMSPVHMPAT